jgi:hypothetical protein
LCLSSPEVQLEIREFSRGLSGGLGVVVGLSVILGIFACYMLGAHWSDFHLHGSFYSAVITLGVMIGYMAALVLLPEPTDTLCIIFPWLLGTAFVLVYGCLFIKTWVLYRVWQKAIHYRRSSITPKFVLKGIGLAFALEIAFLIIWTTTDPPKVRLLQMVDGTYERQCSSNQITFWAIFLSAKGVWLVFGVLLSILTRNIVKEYNDSNSIAYAMYNDIGLAIISVPLSFILTRVPGGALVVEVAAIVLAFSFTLCVLFFNIWYSLLFHEKDVLAERLQSLSPRQSTTISPRQSTTISPRQSTTIDITSVSSVSSVLSITSISSVTPINDMVSQQ